MVLLRALCLFVLLAPLLPVQAGEGDAARAAIQKVAPMKQISGFRRSALPGYYEGIILGQVVYASEDGRYLIRGTAEDLVAGTNLSDASMASKRLERLAALDKKDLISFGPANPTYRVTVFTDVDCPFCRKLHTQIDQYAALGIAIDYALFPLSIHIGADRKSISVWCSADRKKAYNEVMLGRAIEPKSCDNPLTRTMAAGHEIGVTSTPTAIGPDGMTVAPSVLMSPHRLLAELKKISDPARPSP